MLLLVVIFSCLAGIVIFLLVQKVSAPEKDVDQDNNRNNKTDRKESIKNVTCASSSSSSSSTSTSISLHLLLHLVNVSHNLLRMENTQHLLAIPSCCIQHVKIAMNISTSSSSKAQKQKKVQFQVGSTLLLMRHFERLDHVEPSWYKQQQYQQSSSCYFPLDSPLSKQGIEKGEKFSQQIQKRILKFPNDNRFTFIVTSPSLRTLQTSVILASTLATSSSSRVLILVDEGLGDWIQKKVFGSSMQMSCELSLKKKQKNQKKESSSSSSCSSWWELPSLIANIPNSVFASRKESLLKYCGCFTNTDGDDDNDHEASSLCFLDCKTFFAQHFPLTHFDDIFDEKNSRMDFPQILPEPEKDFENRVERVLKRLSRPKKILLSHNTNIPESQKLFSRDQLLKLASHSQEMEIKSSNLVTRNYAVRLLVVTHCDVIRVAATRLTPRCRQVPVGAPLINCGNITHFVGLLPVHDSVEQEQQEEKREEGDENCKVFHLACFSSTSPASCDAFVSS